MASTSGAVAGGLRPSRLRAVAEPGQVVIGQATFDRVRDEARVAALPPLELEGKAVAAAAYVLLDLRPATAHQRRGG